MMGITLKRAGDTGSIIALIVGAILYIEGGHVNNPVDPGGETNYGITITTARQNGYTGPMSEMTKEQATDIYTKEYVIKPGYLFFVELEPAVAHKIIDTAVNCGTARSSKWLQIAINSLSRNGKDYAPIVVDNTIGQNTVNAYKSLVSKRGKVKSCELIIKLMDIQQGSHYLSLTNLREFMVGWIDNRIENIPLEMCVNYEGTYVDIFKDAIK